MPSLASELRRSLEKSVVAARDAAEAACAASLKALGVDASEAPPALSSENRNLRNALCAQQRQLGGAFEQLADECAYEQWHLMLFARFLAENNVLMHPSGAHVTLDEVADLAREQGDSDSWLLAARYAATMLPGIFKPSDPCVRLPLAPEGRKSLEGILAALPAEVFIADDALGWVYQFWQSKKKQGVKASERKIGGVDLAPVTQLFTEDYMVRYLLENSLGAWWAARHPESPLLASFDYLRYTEDREPAVGRFDDNWPESVAEITVMDPCCGSGHFLVAAFDMLRKMRKEEEDLSERDAVDAVLRDNLFGLELDARCVQIAAFALALAAWKLAGYHELPSLSLACSGIPTRGSREEWTKLASGDERLEHALVRLHELFREADTLGSLIDPRRAVEDGTLMSAPFEEVAPLLERALASDPDPVAAVFGEGAREVARAATLLGGSYTLVATNVPFLGGRNQSEALSRFLECKYSIASTDLATAMQLRAMEFAVRGGVVSSVLPQNWLSLRSYKAFREAMLDAMDMRLVTVLGPGAFDTIGGEVVRVVLLVGGVRCSGRRQAFYGASAEATKGSAQKAMVLREGDLSLVGLNSVRARADLRIVVQELGSAAPLDRVAHAFKGMTTGDDPRLRRCFWESARWLSGWEQAQEAPDSDALFSGCSDVLWVADPPGADLPGSYCIRSTQPWGRRGVAVGQVSNLASAVYLGRPFDQSVSALICADDANIVAVLAFCRSLEFSRAVKALDGKIVVTVATLTQVPFDLARWQQVAAEQYPEGLPEPQSDDPTQWLFKGRVVGSHQPLHVALARLVDYRWPDQEPDELDRLADEDGIVCLPPVAGESPAHERMRELLATAYGESFSQQTLDELLAPDGSQSLEDWLRDKAFASHAKLFHARPFIWHLWDGRKDGFAALVNYHGLNHQTLQKLTYTYLGWWIDRQRADAAAEVAGAGARLKAATDLQDNLKLILEGEKPYDIYVRWKPLAEQPLGWQPDLNDGVRLNIRPFIEAGVLRAKLSINWNKDRGKNADGSDRINDVHKTLAEKRAARGGVRAGE